ncbi:hypothetical protein [Microbispora rosea]|uniref:hypothetical protein n=1 Tax=Microbispora rosea TaxID=58117 RepID=UPI003419CB81
MNEFLLGVGSSLVATALTVLGGWLSIKRLRRWPIAMLSRLTGLGIVRLYSYQKQANSDLGDDLADARWVKVFAGRGNELTRDSFRSVLEGTGRRLESVEILLPDPDAGPSSWLSHRESEVRRHDAGYESGLLAEQVRANISYLLAITNQTHHVQLRMYDLPNTCRIILTDRVAYFTPYEARAHGRNSPCLVFRSPGLLYDYALRIFSTAWERATPAKEV